MGTERKCSNDPIKCLIGMFEAISELINEMRNDFFSKEEKKDEPEVDIESGGIWTVIKN